MLLRVQAVMRRAWEGTLLGSALKLVGGALLTIAIVEVVFGRAEYGHLGPIAYPQSVPLGLILLGAIVGILYGLVGMGLILVYRANRIISFAQVGLGLVPALTALLLISNHHWPYFGSVILALVGSAVLGGLVEVLIMRRFLSRARVIATVATIGVAQVLTLPEIYLPKWLANQAVVPSDFPTPFSEFKLNFAGVVFNGNHLAVALLGVVTMAGLTLFFQRTRLGVAVRASAENADRALLLGIPVASLSTIVWAIAGLCSGAAIFARATVVGLPTGTGLSPLILLYGLAAAVIGGMDKLRMALVGGMIIGVLEQTSFYGTSKPDLGAALVLPVILLALLPRSRQLMRALDTGVQSFRTLQEFRPIPVELRRLPEVRAFRVLAMALGAAVFLAAPLYVAERYMGFADIVVIYAIVGVSLVILSGWAGQISLGQMAFAGLGAAVAGGLSANHGQDFFVCLAAAGLAGTVLAVIIGLPALRTQGLFLAVVTFAFAATVANIVLDRQYTSWLLPDPYSQVARPILWGRLDVRGQYGFYYLCVGFLLLAYLAARSIRHSRSARVMIATRDNVRSAQSFGISSSRTRLAAFAISGFMAAVAGGLFAFLGGAVDRQAFSLHVNVEVFIFAVVGGLTSPAGAIAGAVIYEGLHYVGQTYGLAGLDTLGISTGALFILNFAPGGLAQAGFGIRDMVLRRVALRRGIIVPSLLADRDEAASRPEGRRPSQETAAGGPADSLLVCRAVDVAYDSVQVLFGVNLDVRAGEIIALLGTNGAGKSTLLRAISGLNPPSGGEIFFDGAEITKLSPAARLRLGIIQVPGGRAIFPTLTIAEHFQMARWAVTDDAAGARQAQILERFPALNSRYLQLAGNLSGGEQQQLGLGMAFVARPRLLIIDELSLGLAPVVVEQLLRLVRELRDSGTTVLIVEQSVNVALPIADRVFFMEKGEVRFEGSAKELLGREDILRSVFLQGAASGLGQGDKPAATGKAKRKPSVVDARIAGDALPMGSLRATNAAALGNGHHGTSRNGHKGPDTVPAVEASHLGVSFGGVRAVFDVSLAVAAGEILGIIGPNGAGKTTVFDLLSGFVKPTSGQVMIKGIDVTDWSPDDRAWAGLGRSFQDARIFPSMTVAENLATALERHLPMHDHIAPALCLPDVRAVEDDVAWTVADLVELMGLGAFRDKFVRELSTGSRRVVDLAMVLAHDPSVLILDEPSSGIAQRETEALSDLLLRIREETGCAMLVIEHDIPLVTRISDRMLALDLGSVIAEGTPEEVVTNPRVVAAYLGKDEAAVKRSGAAVGIATLLEVAK